MSCPNGQTDFAHALNFARDRKFYRIKNAVAGGVSPNQRGRTTVHILGVPPSRLGESTNTAESNKMTDKSL